MERPTPLEAASAARAPAATCLRLHCLWLRGPKGHVDMSVSVIWGSLFVSVVVMRALVLGVWIPDLIFVPREHEDPTF